MYFRSQHIVYSILSQVRNRPICIHEKSSPFILFYILFYSADPSQKNSAKHVTKIARHGYKFFTVFNEEY